MDRKRKKTPKWYEEQMERSRRFRELIRRNSERYYEAQAAREREQRGEP
jgi:hypothetical protein